MHFDCTSEKLADAVVVTPSGEIDRDTAPELQGVLDDAVRAAGNGRVEVDLHRVTFMDSSGIGTLLAAHRLARSTGATLRVRDPAPQVRMVLDVTNVWDLLS